MHDATLARTTGDPRAVRAVTLAELRRLDAGAGERVPLLDEALDLVLGRGGVVNVELKCGGADRRLLARRGTQSEADEIMPAAPSASAS